HVVSPVFSREKRMDGMMKIVRPLGVHTVPSEFRPLDDPDIVQVAFGDEIKLPSDFSRKVIRMFGQLLEEGFGAHVQDGMDRIEPEGIDVVLLKPVDRVFQEKISQAVAVRIVKIYRTAPGSFILFGEIRSEIREVVAFRAEMVVNRIE